MISVFDRVENIVGNGDNASYQHRVENIVGNGDNASYQHFLLFPQCFQKASSSRLLKLGIVC